MWTTYLIASFFAAPAPQAVFVMGTTLYARAAADVPAKDYVRNNNQLCTTSLTEMPRQKVYLVALDQNIAPMACETHQALHIIGDSGNYADDTDACRCEGMEATCGPYLVVTCPGHAPPVKPTKTLGVAPYVAWIGSPPESVISAGIMETREESGAGQVLVEKIHRQDLYRVERRALLTDLPEDLEGREAYTIVEKMAPCRKWRVGKKQLALQSIFMLAAPKDADPATFRTDVAELYYHRLLAGLFDTTRVKPSPLLLQSLIWNSAEQTGVVAVGEMAGRGLVLLWDERRLTADQRFLARRAVLKTLSGQVVFDEAYSLFDLEDRD